MNEIKNDITEKKNKKIEDLEDSYIITVTVNRNKKRIITVNRFKLTKCRRYIFAKKKSR